MSAPTAPTVEAPRSKFADFLRSAGKLACARQLSGLLFVGAVFALPALTSQHVATDFVWCYFAMMTLTSLLGFGLERLAGTVTAERGDAAPAAALAPVLRARTLTLPLAALSLSLMLAFVGVHLSLAAWCATFVWVSAGLFGPLVFATHRSLGNSVAEPVVMLGVRLAQSAVVLVVASTGDSLAAMVLPVALLESLGVLVGLRLLGPLRSFRRGRSMRTLPVHRAAALAGIEVVGLLNLRADLLLVGRMLGATAGAVYGLLYRVVDGFSGVVGSAGLWLYAESSNGNDGGVASDGIRARSLRLLPRLGIALGAVIVLVSGVVGSVVPEVDGHVGTLRVLVVAFPLLTLNGIELHVRSGRGRNGEVLLINTAVLAVNIGLCLWLVGAVGMIGGAFALAISESVQAALLLVTASDSERRVVAPAFGTAVVGAATLALTAGAMGAGLAFLTVVGVVATAAVVLLPSRIARRAEVVPV